MKTCKNKRHWKAGKYFYTTKECEAEEKKGKHLVPCEREGAHDTFTCTECWKPVALENGMYWFVPLEKQEEIDNYQKEIKRMQKENTDVSK